MKSSYFEEKSVIRRLNETQIKMYRDAITNYKPDIEMKYFKGVAYPNSVLIAADKIIDFENMKRDVYIHNFEEQLSEKTASFNFGYEKIANYLITNLDMKDRTVRCLKAENIWTIGDLIKWTEEELLKTPNIGKNSLKEINDFLLKWNLKLGMRVENRRLLYFEELVKIIDKKGYENYLLNNPLSFWENVRNYLFFAVIILFFVMFIFGNASLNTESCFHKC